MLSSKILLVASFGFGLALAAGCSSSSSSGTPSEGGTGEDSGSSSGATSSSGGSDSGGVNLACMGGDCMGATPVCCATVSLAGGLMVSSSCKPTCTIGMLTPQFCATAAECPASNPACIANPLGTGPKICGPGTAGDGGGSSSGGGDGGGSSSGGADGGGEGGSSSGGEGGADAGNG